MSVAFQGFELSKNLSESVNDGQILNNLAGSPMGADITLLFNNKRNVSTITVTSANIQGSLISFVDRESVYANKTKITVNGSVYYIKDSNFINQFRLSNNKELNDTVSNPPVGDYLRSDEVTFQNIINYGQSRTFPGIDVDRFGPSGGNFQSTADPKTSIESIEKKLDFYDFRFQKSIKNNFDFFGRELILINGVVRIKDPDGKNNLSINDSLDPRKPGLFIYNEAEGKGIRAFSSSENPWADKTTFLECSSSNVTIGDLFFDVVTQGIRFTSKNSAVLANDVTSQIVNPNFTHKIQVSINNEIYFLCLRLEN
jgi:hypothetical protein